MPAERGGRALKRTSSSGSASFTLLHFLPAAFHRHHTLGWSSGLCWLVTSTAYLNRCTEDRPMRHTTRRVFHTDQTPKQDLRQHQPPTQDFTLRHTATGILLSEPKLLTTHTHMHTCTPAHIHTWRHSRLRGIRRQVYY